MTNKLVDTPETRKQNEDYSDLIRFIKVTPMLSSEEFCEYRL